MLPTLLVQAKLWVRLIREAWTECFSHLKRSTSPAPGAVSTCTCTSALHLHLHQEL